jgi:hypothetical protein
MHQWWHWTNFAEQKIKSLSIAGAQNTTELGASSDAISESLEQQVRSLADLDSRFISICAYNKNTLNIPPPPLLHPLSSHFTSCDRLLIGAKQSMPIKGNARIVRSLSVKYRHKSCRSEWRHLYIACPPWYPSSISLIYKKINDAVLFVQPSLGNCSRPIVGNVALP